MKTTSLLERVKKIQNELPDNYAPEAINNIITKAETLLSRKFKIFEINKDLTGEIINWNRDPVSNSNWHVLKKKPILLSWRKNKDIKYVWELNRQQHLCLLGKAYIFTKDDRYSREIISQITGWIDSNPLGQTVNWISPLEISLRLVSWIWALSFICDSKAINEQVEEKIISSIYLQAKFIAANLQTRALPNNHLIGELAGMAIVGVIFPEFDEASDWREKSIKKLSEQIQQQVYPDGVDKEHAWDYHRFVLDFYTQVVIIYKKYKTDIPQVLLDCLEKMYEVLMFVLRPDGFAPMIGDDDSGLVLKVGDQSGNFYTSALSTGAVLFNRGDMKWCAGKFHEEACFLLGREGAEAFARIEAVRPKITSKEFKKSGQYVMRSGWNKEALCLYFDCGSQGMGQAGHGHADALSFELFAYGNPLIIDPGTYTYNGPKEWRNFFRGTAAHNTVVIDDIDQAEHLKPYEAFGWEQKADARPLRWYTSERFDFVSAEHDGYKRLKKPVIHRRDILFVKPEYWLMYDVILGKGSHKININYHFNNEKVKLDDRTKIVDTCNRDNGNIRIIPIDSNGFQMEIVTGRVNPIQGWVSESYGEKRKATVLQYTKEGTIPLTFLTLLYPFKNSDNCPIQVESVDLSDEINDGTLKCAKVVFSMHTDYCLFAYESGSLKSFAGIQTDAKTAYIRVDNNNTVIQAVIEHGSFLMNGSSKIICLDKQIPFSEMFLCDGEKRIIVSEGN